MNSYDFQGQTAVVTGGANGIGLAIATLLARSGAIVAIWDREGGLPDEAAAAIPSAQRRYVSVDVTDLAAVEAAAAETIGVLGRIDVLVANAGIAGPISPLWTYPVDMWRQIQAVNLDGVFNCCRSVVPAMIANGYGRIVNIASIAGKEGNVNASAYSASKAAVIALTKSLGKELAGHDIAVNCLTLGTVNTRILEQVGQDYVDLVLSKIPRARFLKVEEVARMVAWVASRDNSSTTGAVFDITGGRATY